MGIWKLSLGIAGAETSQDAVTSHGRGREESQLSRSPVHQHLGPQPLNPGPHVCMASIWLVNFLTRGHRSVGTGLQMLAGHTAASA